MFKAIFKFIGTLALIATAVCLVTVGIMFVSTKVNPQNPIKVFGFSLVQFDENTEKVLSQYGNSTFSNIEINVKDINVEVVGTEESAIHLDIYNKMWGIAKVEEDKTYGTTYAIENETLVISVNQPNGVFLNTQNTSLTLSIPKSYSAKSLTINGVNSHIAVGNSDHEYLKLANAQINVKNSNIKIYKTKALENVEINSEYNKVDVKSNVSGELKLKTKSCTFNFETAGTLSVEGSNLKLNGNTVNVAANITIKSGEAKIQKAIGDVNITSTSANITVQEAFSNVTLKTNSGNCNVTFANTASQDAQFNATAKNGSITANNIRCATNIQVEEGGSCKVNANFAQLIGQNTISGQKGAVSVVTPVQQYLLSVENTGEKDIAFTEIDTTDNITEQPISGATPDCETKLKISATSGKITLKTEN